MRPGCRSESARPDRWFNDPYAAAFAVAGRELLPAADSVRTDEDRAVISVMGLQVAVRNRFYDDYLMAATAAGCRQVVLLAAGLDTRAFRLPWPDGVRLFELDLPELVEFNDGVLAGRDAVPRCTRTVVRVDLRDDWSARLTAAGLDPAAPVAWLIEGLLVYLDAEEATGLLTAVGELSAPGSRLSCEHRPQGTTSLLDAIRGRSEVARVTDMWKGGLGRRLPDWLDRAGWQVRTEDARTLAGSYGRSVPDMVGLGFLTAVRAEAPAPTS